MLFNFLFKIISNAPFLVTVNLLSMTPFTEACEVSCTPMLYFLFHTPSEILIGAFRNYRNVSNYLEYHVTSFFLTLTFYSVVANFVFVKKLQEYSL